MPARNVLLVDGSSVGATQIEKALQGEGYLLQRAATPEEALRLVTSQDIQIVLLSLDPVSPDGIQTARAMRSAQRDTPLQIVLLAPSEAEEAIRAHVAAGSDDFIRVPFDTFELQARTRAAQIRWESQSNLVKEREFYRIAVAEEERLSSLVLDQNHSLKDAYDKIRRLNEELEKANRELERIAAVDSLSGLLNRRSLFSRISIEIERSIRLDVPLAGLMVDIDRFKGINDNFGHQCGDVVLREMGAKLSDGLRKYDYAGRYGGEEFFVVLSNSTEEQALRIGDRFRREIEESRFQCGGETIGITVSIGVSRYVHGESQESWIERADRAMYQAKQAGRNRIIGS
jgi:diguanylate cyclase (GGDEF)-like protein